MKLPKRRRLFQVLIEADRRMGTAERAYTAYVPVLGIATDGETFEAALSNAREATAAYVGSLVADGIDASSVADSTFVAAATINI